MTLKVLTHAGDITLGDAPTTALSCAVCSKPAQVIANTAKTTASVCADCAADAIVVAVLMVGEVPGVGG